MELEIIPADKPIFVGSIILLVFAEPGVGKTSFGYTTSKPLLLDADRGAHRSGFRKDTARAESWQAFASINPSDIAPYDTIVVDTVGRMLDLITLHIAGMGKKHLVRKSGALTQNGYGELKAIFVAWVKKIQALGKDIVFLAHNRESKNGDDLIFRPDIQGGSYGEIFKVADAVAYGWRDGNQTVLNFSPSDSHAGKDTAGIGKVAIPDFNQVPDFGASIISKIKGSINAASEAGRIVTGLVDGYRPQVAGLACPEDFNVMLLEVNAIENEIAKSQIKSMMGRRCKELGISYSEGQGFVFNDLPKSNNQASDTLASLKESLKETSSEREYLDWEIENAEVLAGLGKVDKAVMDACIKAHIDQIDSATSAKVAGGGGDA